MDVTYFRFKEDCTLLQLVCRRVAQNKQEKFKYSDNGLL